MVYQVKLSKPRGFAAMPPERVREIAAMGGRAAQSSGAPGHRWTREEAIVAGRKGGKATISKWKALIEKQ
jgi:uncharacterized protein